MLSQTIMEDIKKATIRAGQKILEVRNAGFDVEKKQDGSPVTKADQAAESIILETLTAITPDIAIVAEEKFAAECGDGDVPPSPSTFFLVDALDGTKSFVEGGEGFTVNVALVENKRAVFGVVYEPCSDDMYVGDVVEGKALKIKQASTETPDIEHIKVRKRPDNGGVILSSVHHIDAETKGFLDRFPEADIRPTSSSIKFCRIAEGAADMYPRFGPIMEWDTAAGQAVLNAAGGYVLDPEGKPFLYGKAGYRNTSFLALGDDTDTSFWA